MSLTRHPPASVRELTALALPLMLTSLSFFFMIFVDRLFLAAYDLNAMTAAVSASIVGVTFLAGLCLIGSIAEVFVGRRYGAKEYQSLGAPVWQMVWLSVFSTAFFVPFAFWGVETIFGPGRELEAIYLKWMLLSAPIAFAYHPLAAFFIGRGKTKVIVWVAIATNVLNILLDYLLIFGVEGTIPPLGIQGAVLATCMGTSFQTFIFLALFLRKKYRQVFGTSNWKLDFPLFKECVYLGIPAGLSMTIELAGWSLFYEMMRRLGTNHMLLAGIFQSLLMLFFFFPEGLNKAVTAIVANYIGEKKEQVIPKVILSALISVFIPLAAALLLSPYAVEWIRNAFFAGQFSPIDPLLLGGWVAVLLYIGFEGVRTTYLALLTSYKETRYILISGVASVFLFIFIPFFIFLSYTELSELNALLIALLFPAGHAFLLFLRSRSLLYKPTTQAIA